MTARRNQISFRVMAVMALIILAGLLEPVNSAVQYRYTQIRGVDFLPLVPTHRIGVASGIPLHVCANLCIENLECASFFYHYEHEDQCQMYSVLFDRNVKGRPANGLSYYIITDERCGYTTGYSVYRVENLCYKIEKGNDWIKALHKRCHNVNVKNSNIQQFLVKAVKVAYPTNTPSFTIGATRNDAMVWNWSDGTPITWFNWAPGQSGTSRWETCIVADASNDFKWKAVRCFEKMDLVYICSVVTY